MEDSAIQEGFDNLRPGTEYDALYEAALCRERADWIVGINATRLFSTLYGQTLNVGRVMTPNGMDVVESIRKDLAAGNTAPYREFLDSVIAESGDEVSVTAAKALRDQLDKFDTPKRASVMELLAQNAEKVAPAKPHKHKEPER